MGEIIIMTDRHGSKPNKHNLICSLHIVFVFLSNILQRLTSDQHTANLISPTVMGEIIIITDRHGSKLNKHNLICSLHIVFVFLSSILQLLTSDQHTDQLSAKTVVVS